MTEPSRIPVVRSATPKDFSLTDLVEHRTAPLDGGMVLLAISDGAHAGGNPDFFFLPPLAPDPSGHPMFDPDAFDPAPSPRVEICEVTGAACAAVQPAGFPIVFGMTGGEASTDVRVVTADEHYVVNWHTSDYELDAMATYRIGVYVDTQPLGFADLDLVSSGSELKNVNTGEYIALEDGRTLPIKFRIEEGFRPGSISLLPMDWRMPVGATVQFATEVSGAAGGEIVWAVDGIPGGDASVGLIDVTGTFTATAAGDVVVSATVGAGLSAASPVTVTEGGEAARVDWSLFTPRVVSAALQDDVTFDVGFSGYPTLELERSGGGILAPAPYRAGVYRFVLSPDQLLTGYTLGDLHNFVGFLDCAECASGARRNTFVNVRDNTVPDVTIVALGPEAQAASHIANLRYDPDWGGGSTPHPPADAVRPFYTYFPDEFDFLAVIQSVNTTSNRSYASSRNDVTGLGLAVFDNGRAASLGSASRLRGDIAYPISTFFDGASPTASHEVAHAMMAFLDNPVLVPSVPHWPKSSLAVGIMGYSLPGGVGGSFPYEVREVSPGVHELVCSARSLEFNDIE
ncbi:MAG TPA: hypothetical protein VLA09_08990, partial [Longimicrobiales bacterium]|nr:hypothetical protein [Longimicrobiales bacterium]